jgi:hypothetical protein
VVLAGTGLELMTGTLLQSERYNDQSNTIGMVKLLEDVFIQDHVFSFGQSIDAM